MGAQIVLILLGVAAAVVSAFVSHDTKSRTVRAIFWLCLSVTVAIIMWSGVENIRSGQTITLLEQRAGVTQEEVLSLRKYRDEQSAPNQIRVASGDHIAQGTGELVTIRFSARNAQPLGSVSHEVRISQPGAARILKIYMGGVAIDARETIEPDGSAASITYTGAGGPDSSDPLPLRVQMDRLAPIVVSGSHGLNPMLVTFKKEPANKPSEATP